MKRYVKAAVPMTLRPEEMNNPDSVDFKKMYQTRQKEADDKAADDELEAKKAELREKHAGLLDRVAEMPNKMDALDLLFEELVPASGEAETAAGEIVRAMMRILYRDYNDGDVFYEGYGKETCGAAADFVRESVPEVEDDLIEIAERGLTEDDYTKAIEGVASEVVQHIIDNPELIETVNEDNCLLYDEDFWNDYSLKYSTSVTIPDVIWQHVDLGHITKSEVEDFIDSIVRENCNKEAEWYEGYPGTYEIESLDSESCSEVDYNVDTWLEEFERDLAREYGDPYEDDEDDEDDEDYDDDEEEDEEDE